MKTRKKSNRKKSSSGHRETRRGYGEGRGTNDRSARANQSPGRTCVSLPPHFGSGGILCYTFDPKQLRASQLVQFFDIDDSVAPLAVSESVNKHIVSRGTLKSLKPTGDVIDDRLVEIYQSARYSRPVSGDHWGRKAFTHLMDVGIGAPRYVEFDLTIHFEYSMEGRPTSVVMFANEVYEQ